MEQQAARRDDLRARAGALVAAASVVTAFLGGQVLDGPAGFSVGAWVAIVSFVVLVAGSAYVLAPRPWVFVTSASDLLDEYVEGERIATVDDMRRDLALFLEVHYESNVGKLNGLASLLQAGCVLLIVEIAAWLVALTGSR